MKGQGRATALPCVALVPGDARGGNFNGIRQDRACGGLAAGQSIHVRFPGKLGVIWLLASLSGDAADPMQKCRRSILELQSLPAITLCTAIGSPLQGSAAFPFSSAQATDRTYPER